MAMSAKDEMTVAKYKHDLRIQAKEFDERLKIKEHDRKLVILAKLYELARTGVKNLPKEL